MEVGMMFTVVTAAGIAVTLVSSAVMDKVLHHYGKGDLAETLTMLTHVGALAYGTYFVVTLIQASIRLFL
jgi:hypothetical protein